jgi:integrase
MALTKRGGIWWIDFWFAGERIQESTKTGRKTIAKAYEDNKRKALEAALAGIPAENPKKRIRTVADVCKTYRENFSGRPKTIEWVKDRLPHLEKRIGHIRLIDLNEDVIRQYIKRREREEMSGRSINIELSLLSRAIGKPWKLLWPNVRKLEERTDVGRALSADEQKCILVAALANRSPIVGTALRMLLLTAMRSGELLSMTWDQVDFHDRKVTVGRAKTSSGTGRVIPINDELLRVLEGHLSWYKERFGEARGDWYVFPAGTAAPTDPTQPMQSIKKAWTSIRAKAHVNARLHDLRHTALTMLAESQASESTMLSIAGHMSRKMLERYSHIRNEAKRKAMAALSTPTIDFSGVPTKVPTVAKKWQKIVAISG